MPPLGRAHGLNIPRKEVTLTMKCHGCGEKGCADGSPCVGGDVSRYTEDEVRAMRAAGEIEARYYGELCRFDEIMEFARLMGVARIGMAFCIGFASEARTAAEVFGREFEVVSVCCKVEGLLKDDFGIESRPWVGGVACNPAKQAEALIAAGSELNVVLGLCVGHDAIFLRHSAPKVWTIPLVVKDRRLGHNPVAALTCQYVTNRLGKPPIPREV